MDDDSLMFGNPNSSVLSITTLLCQQVFDVAVGLCPVRRNFRRPVQNRVTAEEAVEVTPSPMNCTACLADLANALGGSD